MDYAKGIGIMLVVWGHTSLWGFHEIYAFHMPLFFFIAGFFFNENVSLSQFLSKKIKSLIIPYFLFYCFTIVFYGLLLLLTNRDENISWQLLKGFFPIDNNIINTPLWFLYALFWMSLLYYFLRKSISSNLVILCVTLLLFSLNEILIVYDVHLPFFMNRSLGELIYMHIGYCCFNRFHILSNINSSVPLLKIGIVCVFFITFIFLFKLELNNEFWVHYLKIPVAFCGLMVGVVLAQLFQNGVGFLSYLGRHSLVFFSLHLPLFELARPIAKRMFSVETIFHDLSLFFLVMLFTCVVGELTMMLFPKYLGRGLLTTYVANNKCAHS